LNACLSTRSVLVLSNLTTEGASGEGRRIAGSVGVRVWAAHSFVVDHSLLPSRILDVALRRPHRTVPVIEAQPTLLACNLPVVQSYLLLQVRSQ
jgi:hypothetical protein